MTHRIVDVPRCIQTALDRCHSLEACVLCSRARRSKEALRDTACVRSLS